MLPPKKKIPFNRAPVCGTESAYISQTIRTGRLGGLGEFTRRCQEWIQQLHGRGQVFLTPSCTSALEMAAILLDIKPGDEVIVPSYTYVSTVNAWLLRGATLVYVDIDPSTMNIDHNLIEVAITERTRAVVVVYYAGVACEMDTVMAIAKCHGLFVVEDAAQAFTSTYKSRRCGAIGQIGCFSFHETKNFTSGGQGGAICINDESLLPRARVVFHNGTNRQQFLEGLANHYAWQDIGSNFFMSEVQASSLWAQLEHAEAIQAKRHKLWTRYALALQPLVDRGHIRRPSVPKDCTHNAHIFFFKLESPAARSRFIHHMREADVVVSAHFVPLH